MLTLLLAVASILVPYATAVSSNHLNYVVHERRPIVDASEWTKHSRAEGSQILPVRIGLKQRNLELAENYIMNVASPDSRNFGRHWTAEDVANTFAPTEETNNRVIQWLESSGVSRKRISHSAGRNWIQFDATVHEVEHLLKTEYDLYEHKATGNKYITCGSYSLPHGVKPHIDFIMPTVHLSGLHRISNPRLGIKEIRDDVLAESRSKTRPMSGLTGLKHCDRIVTIECLRALYNFPAGKTKHSGNQMGIGEWDNYLYRPDLKAFFHRLTKPTIPNDTFPEFVSIDGGHRAAKGIKKTPSLEFDTAESAEDFELAYSIIHPQGTRLYQTGDGVNVNSVGTFNIFLDALDASYCTYKGGDSPKQDPHYPDPKAGGYKGPLQCGGAPKSNVISISYGQEEVNLTPAYQHRQCHEWMKLALQGTTVVFASGDSGVANRYNAGFPNKCLAAHSDKKSVDGPRFNPGFPGNCPWVTVAGGTDLLTKSIHGGEKAVEFPDRTGSHQSFFSGGGFSNVFTMPKYQAKAVTHYLTKYPPPYNATHYNNSGNARAYPDVAALATGLAIVVNGTTSNGGGGTSASAPIVGGLITLINEARMEKGKGPVGFVNPVFYANPNAFNDVTVGKNPGCGTKGFACQPGWDPVTGLGSINFEKLKKVFMALP